MAHVPDEQAVQSLEKDVAKSLDTLRILTRTKASHLVGKSQTLPVEEIALAAGLVFLHTTKAGFVVSAVTGHGFLIKKIPNSPSGWSAPLPLDLKSAGVGLAAGVSTADLIMILDTEKAVQDFLHTQISLDSEVSLATGPAGRNMHSAEFNVTHPNDTFSGATYSVAHGAMVDLSFQGVKLNVKANAMKKLYGQTTYVQVMDGAVPQLPVAEPLIAELQMLQHGGSTPSAAELAKK